MSTLKDLKHENTLSGLASAGTSCNYLIWAVIIDISEPTKSSNSSNFVTYLKIIDPSLNYRVKNNTCKDLRFHKYVTVYIYTETPEVAPKINYVGEIIRLRRFKFKVTDNGELIGVMNKFSNWLIYIGDANSQNLKALYCKLT